MDFRKILIGVAVLALLSVIIIVAVKSRQSGKQCIPACNVNETCVNGTCQSVCGARPSQVPANSPWYCNSPIDMICDGKNWVCATDLCLTPNLNDIKDMIAKTYNIDANSLVCDSIGIYSNTDCSGNGKKYYVKQNTSIPDSGCTCNTGYVGINCQYSNATCNNHGIPDENGNCTCSITQTINNITYSRYYGDKCQNDCGSDDQHYDSTQQKCVCNNSNFTVVNGKCQPSEICGGHGSVQNGACQCDSGYVVDPDNSNNCLKCQGTFANNKCTCIITLDTNDKIQGCDKVYYKATYQYGADCSNTKSCYTSKPQNQLSINDITIGENGVATCNCEDGTCGDMCQNNANTLANCNGTIDKNCNITCNVNVDKTKIIKGCGDFPDTYYTTYYTSTNCDEKSAVSCYMPLGTKIEDAILNGKCKCTQNSCAGPKGDCSQTICTECNGNSNSITCDVNGNFAKCDCKDGFSGIHCLCQDSNVFTAGQGTLLMEDICTGYPKVDIWKCYDTDVNTNKIQCPSGSNTNLQQYGYCMVEPETCKEYNDYVTKLVDAKLLNADMSKNNNLLCNSSCPSGKNEGPYCSDNQGNAQFTCYPSCDTQQVPPVCNSGEYLVCDVTTGFVPKCVSDYINYGEREACNNMTKPDNWDSTCPGQEGIAWKKSSCTIGGVDGCVYDCKLPGVYTVPRECINNYYDNYYQDIPIYNTNDKITLWSFTDNTSVSPTILMKKDSEQARWIGQSHNATDVRYGQDGSNWSWIFGNKPGHIIPRNFTD